MNCPDCGTEMEVFNLVAQGWDRKDAEKYGMGFADVRCQRCRISHPVVFLAKMRRPTGNTDPLPPPPDAPFFTVSKRELVKNPFEKGGNEKWKTL